MKHTELDMRRVKKVRHPLIEGWAKKHAELEYEMRQAIGKMSDLELKGLVHAASSLTSTNCWFAEHDVAPMVQTIVASEQYSRSLKSKKKATDNAASTNATKEKS